MPKNTDLYFITDIEADGPIPGPHSMLSLASVVLTPDGVIGDHLVINFDLLEGATPDPDTTEFWNRNPQAYNETRRDTLPPSVGMNLYWAHVVDMVQTHGGQPVFVASPSAYDFMFVYWYLRRFTGGSPFSHSALDVKSVAWTLLGGTYKAASGKAKRKWPSKVKHNHTALDDALNLAERFAQILKDRQRTIIT